MLKIIIFGLFNLMCYCIRGKLAQHRPYPNCTLFPAVFLSTTFYNKYIWHSIKSTAPFYIIFYFSMLSLSLSTFLSTLLKFFFINLRSPRLFCPLGYCLHSTLISTVSVRRLIRSRGYKTFFTFNSAEHEILTVHICWKIDFWSLLVHCIFYANKY